MTPTNLSDVEDILRDPITGQWTIPRLVLNTAVINPLWDIDPLNDDPNYQRRVVEYYHTKLTEKWLYSAPIYRSLLKYFKATKRGSEVTVELISNPEKESESNITSETEKYVFKFIEKYFITEHFVKKVLKEYVQTTHIKWYDLYFNNSELKDLFRHKLKRVIISTIYELNEK